MASRYAAMMCGLAWRCRVSLSVKKPCSPPKACSSRSAASVSSSGEPVRYAGVDRHLAMLTELGAGRGVHRLVEIDIGHGVTRLAGAHPGHRQQSDERVPGQGSQLGASCVGRVQQPVKLTGCVEIRGNAPVVVR